MVISLSFLTDCRQSSALLERKGVNPITIRLQIRGGAREKGER
ncbi:hypothetical protein ES708_20546 [subsurface metagenome]